MYICTGLNKERLSLLRKGEDKLLFWTYFKEGNKLNIMAGTNSFDGYIWFCYEWHTVFVQCILLTGEKSSCICRVSWMLLFMCKIQSVCHFLFFLGYNKDTGEARDSLSVWNFHQCMKLKNSYQCHDWIRFSIFYKCGGLWPFRFVWRKGGVSLLVSGEMGRTIYHNLRDSSIDMHIPRDRRPCTAALHQLAGRLGHRNWNSVRWGQNFKISKIIYCYCRMFMVVKNNKPLKYKK